MKRITKLDEVPTALDGKPMGDNGRLLTVKEMIANCLQMAQTNEPALAVNLAQRFFTANGSLDLEPHEMNLALQHVTESGYPAIAKVAMLEALRDAEEVKDGKD